MFISAEYAIVDAVLTDLSGEGAIPRGARGRLFNAIDAMRRNSAPSEYVTLAERISATMQRLEWSVFQGAQDRIASVRGTLTELQDAWHHLGAPQSEHSDQIACVLAN